MHQKKFDSMWNKKYHVFYALRTSLLQKMEWKIQYLPIFYQNTSWSLQILRKWLISQSKLDFFQSFLQDAMNLKERNLKSRNNFLKISLNWSKWIMSKLCITSFNLDVESLITIYHNCTINSKLDLYKEWN